MNRIHLSRLFVLCVVFATWQRGGAEPAGKPAAQPDRKPFPAGSLFADRVAFEFAVYYLPRPSRDPEEMLRELCGKHFPGLRIVKEPAPAGSPPTVVVTMPEIATYAPPGADLLKHFGRGLTPDQARSLGAAERVLRADFSAGRTDALKTLKEATRLMGMLARGTNGLLWDQETREVFSPGAWEAQRLDPWKDGSPDLSKHIVIHIYPDGDLMRAVTLGMGKFGLPDVAVCQIPRSLVGPIGTLITITCQTMAERGTLATEGRMVVDIDELQNEAGRKIAAGSVLKGAKRKAEMRVALGVRDEGDADNRLLEITFPAASSGSVQEAQNALVTEIFGAADSITYAEHDEELLAASRRAKEKIKALAPRFRKGLLPDERLLVKAPFKTPKGGNEWMWVEVVTWEGEKIKGVLANDPFDIPDLKAGARVEVSEEALFDYLLYSANGKTEGNETGDILERREKAEEK